MGTATRRAARAGLVGLAFTNAFANFPAWGTRVPSLGNNPLAIGIPTADGEPVVLDLAMTQSSISRVRQAEAAGRSVPEGWGLDERGRPTTDPSVLLQSWRFLPMGQHKGSGLAFMVDLLTAGLAGGLLAFEQGTENGQRIRPAAPPSALSPSSPLATGCTTAVPI